MRKLPKIILASQSKRRIKLLKDLHIPFSIKPANIEEKNISSLTPQKNAILNAKAKCEYIASSYKNAIVIACDTIVVFKNKVIGKPKTLTEADKFLKNFSGNSLNVISALYIKNTQNNKTSSSTTKTKIKVKKIPPKIRKTILKTINPLDRAGGFSIEGVGAIFFDNINGSFYNVIGLPLGELYKNLKNVNINLEDYING